MDGSAVRKQRTNGGHKQRQEKIRRDVSCVPSDTLGAPTVYTTTEMLTRARSLTDKALGVLEDIADNGENETARVGAALGILDRGYGKPMQMIATADLTPQQAIDVTALSEEELLLFEKLLRKASAGSVATVAQSTGTED